MSAIGMQYIRRVVISDEKDTPMSDMDFTLDFYVYKNKRQHLNKSDLISVIKDGVIMYFAIINGSTIGYGKVNCEINIYDVEKRLQNHIRRVSIIKNIGLTIGESCECETLSNNTCDCFEEGYKIRFEPYFDIPLQDGVNIKYGIITEPITGYDKITEDMVKRFDFGLELKNHVFTFNRGDKVVILVNEDLDVKAYKDSGFGDLMQFNTSVCGANGEYSVVVDGVHYRVYGEMMLVNGEIKVTVR